VPVSAPPAPGQPPYNWIAHARIPGVLIDSDLPTGSDGLVAADLRIEAGRIAAIEAPADRGGGAVLNQRDGIVLPCFVDMHTHIDKGHIWPRKPNPDGTFDGALASVAEDRTALWSAEDVRRRMDFALRCAHAHGTAALCPAGMPDSGTGTTTSASIGDSSARMRPISTRAPCTFWS